jgi:hypothetical protein
VTIFVSENHVGKYFIDARNEDVAKEASQLLWGDNVEFTVYRETWYVALSLSKSKIITIDNDGCLVIPDAYGPAEDGWVGKLSEW